LSSELDHEVLSFVLGSLPPAPARVLEVGAGDGSLAAALGEAGYDVLAIDPASETASVRAVPLHELDAPSGSFDAVVAVVAMHHVRPLPDSCRRLAQLMRAGGTLVLDEFDVGRFDDRAARWLLEHLDPHGRTPDDVIADLRHHCHPLGDLQAELGRSFELEDPVYGPYLYRFDPPQRLRETEERLIEAGKLPATGARVVGQRR
jgi:SAM-dependent methyltransferase